jgi:amino acid adenylation domain-containing protein
VLALVHGAEPNAFRNHWVEAIRLRFTNDADRVALRSSQGAMTYGELGRRVAGLTSMLRARGIGKQDQVGVGFHRGFDLIISLLALIECGASYVPIDPGYPKERIRQMIASAGLKWILSNRIGSFDTEGVEILRPEDAGSGEVGPLISPDGRDPIYAIFTSGSTGNPKAAAVFHSGFANLLEWYGKELALGPDDRTLVISSPSFDLTQKNLFAPLVAGGTLILDDAETYDITRITGLIREHGVTLINCTPSAFYPLVDAAGENFAALASLRFAVLGGEPISVPRLRGWLEHSSCKAEVVNSYGPTECTDICLFHRLHRGNLDAFSFVPLGREIPNVEVTIRDENLALLADGEIGELCIAGIGLGAGYLNDAARTAERFVSDVYRSGDLAIRLPCGTFEFRGRADHQVKVNGHRIELGEIEIVLSEHDSVTEAVVVAKQGGLIAHVKGGGDATVLREHLTSKLPAYMIPGRFVFLDNFPLTPNGKVDRKALMDETSAAAVDTPLNGGHETMVLALWSELLGTPVTDPIANFFDLGGSSIHLAVMHVRLREMSGRDLSITDLFAMPTARAIATFLSNEEPITGASAARDRARLARTGFSRFHRPASR